MKLQKYLIPAILILGVLGIGVYLFLPKTANNVNSREEIVKNEDVAKVARAKSIEEQNKLAISQTDVRGPYKLVAEVDGQNALSLLDKYTNVAYQEYEFGTLVKSINGIANNKQDFWAFYVNGEFANKSISKTNLNAGDVIELIYERLEVHKGM